MQHKSQRQLQMGENLKRILAEIFLKNNYSSINGNITTILEVSMSPDLKNARVFIDVFGNNATHIVDFLQHYLGVQWLSSNIYFVDHLPVHIDWHDILQIVFVALGLSWLATIYPSWRAGKIIITEALHHE